METTKNHVNLKVGNTTFWCCKETLMSNSDYFNAMFTSNMKECFSETVHLEDGDPEVFKLLLEYMTTSKVDLLTEDNVYEVTQAARVYQVGELVQQCGHFIRRRVTLGNCVENFVFADNYGINSVYNLCRHLILWNFTSLKSTTSFLDFPKPCFLDIILDSQLNITSEAEVIIAVELWVNHDIGRKEYLEEILVKSGYCNYLCTEDVEILRKTFPDHSDITTSLMDICSQHTRERKVRRTAGAVLLFGCLSGDSVPEAHRSKACLWRLDVSDRKFIHLDDAPLDIMPSMDWDKDTGYRICSHGAKMFICGGTTKLSCDKLFPYLWCYDFLRREWKMLTKLPSPRRHHGLCVVDDRIFLIGGIGRFRVKLESVNSYNYVTDEWRECAPLPEPAYNVATYVDNGKIYASSHMPMIYDVVKDQWTSGPEAEREVLRFQDKMVQRDKVQLDGFTYKLDDINFVSKDLTGSESDTVSRCLYIRDGESDDITFDAEPKTGCCLICVPSFPDFR